MKVELLVAFIAGFVALLSAAGTIWSSIRVARISAENTSAIEKLKNENDRVKALAQKQIEICVFSEPLARSCYDLQSRIFNILRQNLLRIYLINGSDREKSYVINNTAFLVAQYLCWTELVRREIQFIDLGEESRTRDLLRLQDTIYNSWGSDDHSPIFRIFAGEQRAIGEALIQSGNRGKECMGYGAFLKCFKNGANPLIDAIREDVIVLSSDLSQANIRLTVLQHALIDLLEMLDPLYLRFPYDRRTKV